MRKRSGRELSSTLPDYVGLVPGYDPAATAGDCTFDADRAKAAIDFFDLALCHIKGDKAAQPFTLEPWQEAIVGNLFGWYRPDGRRRYREAFVFVPRKNGKSLLAAGIGLYMLFVDQEQGAEIYAAAAERDQAALVFDVAKHMVLRDALLAGQAKVYQKSITVEDRASFFRAISADADTKHGFNAHCVIMDELHAQRNRELHDVLMTSQGARTQPLFISITTSDYEREGSICNEKYEFATRVRDGVIDDPTFLPVIYEADRDDDWTDPETWRKANPNLGVSISQEYLERECARAQEVTAYENTFKRLYLNIRTEQAVRWLQLEKWDACAGAHDWRTLRTSLRGCQAWAGMDLASKRDLSALALLFKEHGRYQVVPFFWVPEDGARERQERDRVPYLDWIKEGLITATPGKRTDYDVIRRDVNALLKEFSFKEVALDPWNANQFGVQLSGDGFDVIEFRQGFASMNEPTKELEALIVDGTLEHGGHPILRWMASNVSVRTDPAGNWKPDKEHSSEKIDGIVAMIMALGRATIAPEYRESVYRTRGFVRL